MDAGVQLTIVDDSEDWLVVTNGTDLLFLPTNNLSDCEDNVYNPNIVIFAVQTPMNCIIILSAVCIIFLHLCLKDLRNEFGVLVVIMCFFVVLTNVAVIVHGWYQFIHKVNNMGNICAVIVYTRLTFAFCYHSTVITIYLHFAYLMYNTYKLRAVGPNLNGKLICKYIAFIVLLTTTCMSLLITCDAMSNRTAFVTVDGYCVNKVDDNTNVFSWVFLVTLLFLIAAQTIMFSIGMILYFVVSRDFCAFKTTDVRVCLALISTSGLHAVLFVIFYFVINLDHSTSKLFTTIGALVEQLILLMMLLKKAVTSNSSQNRSCKKSRVYACM